MNEKNNLTTTFIVFVEKRDEIDTIIGEQTPSYVDYDIMYVPITPDNQTDFKNQVSDVKKMIIEKSKTTKIILPLFDNIYGTMNPLVNTILIKHTTIASFISYELGTESVSFTV